MRTTPSASCWRSTVDAERGGVASPTCAPRRARCLALQTVCGGVAVSRSEALKVRGGVRVAPFFYPLMLQPVVLGVWNF